MTLFLEFHGFRPIRLTLDPANLIITLFFVTIGGMAATMPEFMNNNFQVMANSMMTRLGEILKAQGIDLKAALAKAGF